MLFEQLIRPSAEGYRHDSGCASVAGTLIVSEADHNSVTELRLKTGGRASSGISGLNEIDDALAIRRVAANVARHLLIDSPLPVAVVPDRDTEVRSHQNLNT